ncbi:hypothetical protein FYJ80_00175 [Spirochaetales bacterium NM-380-WT-3C1]|uniref:BIG2 domain-containing protein n=1 Tax=Bullifex porci TaxID=2606638 RepID=A0A7X2PAB9_9SPIO|nr:hypothetical protein [Bullifex porci]MSU05202.1 hypothetical protein [Bullifex porci]
MKKALSIFLCILSLFIIFSCNNDNKAPEVKETPKHELTGKTITISLYSTRNIDFSGPGTLTMTFESDEKTASWTYTTETAAKSGTFSNISVVSENGNLKITSGENLNLTLSKEETGYKTVGEGKVATLAIPADTPTKLLEQNPVTSIDQLKGHTFFGAGSNTAAQIIITETDITFKYYTNYNPEGHSLGTLKAFAECEINQAKLEDNNLVIPSSIYGSDVTTFEIINSSTLRMISAEKIVLNLIK